jgi:hypothetical protein
VNGVGVLVERLRVVPPGRPVEESGATAVFAAISGCAVDALMQSRGPRPLTQREQQLLQSMKATTGHERCGTMYAGNVRAAVTTAILLPQRVPAAVRATLGIGPDGETLPGIAGVPLGRALSGLGARREPLDVVATPGEHDGDGHELVLRSTARLWLDRPIAIVTERVYREFLDAFPIRGSLK